MNQEILQIFRRAEGRYFNDGEARALENYAENLLARVDTMAAIERAEPGILDDVVAGLERAYPQIVERSGPDAFQRARRDYGQVLRYAALGMLTMDPDMVYDRFAVWLRTIMNALADPQMVLNGYRLLLDACRNRLTPDDAALVLPFVEIVVREHEDNLPSAGGADGDAQGRAA